jgi:predicted dienelactone hydrolase
MRVATPARAAAAATIVATIVALAPPAAPAVAAERAHQVRHVTLTFVDRSRPTEDPNVTRSARTRTLVTEVWLPRGRGRFPLVVFAHGNSGHPLKLTQMLSAWARAGYVVAAPAFPLTNDRSGGPSIIPDFQHQPADVSFVITRMLAEDRRAGSPVHGKVARNHIGAAGHSLGGATLYGVTSEQCCRDRRVDAAIFMDAVRLPSGDGPRPAVDGPGLYTHITGDAATPYAATLEQYERATPPKFMMTLTQGIHFEPFENAPSPHDRAVVDATTSFWDAYLRHERGAVRGVVRGGTEAGLSTVDAVLR